MISEASLGEMVPAAHSASTADDALAASAADPIVTGNSKATRRSRFGGTKRSKHNHNAVVSPSSA